MDYDDNEFQDQNCHVRGEGSSKLSPVLNSYALSKFDFDDGLQGHLRFDSLVENEVFLGIQSQEDKQWIEDFSRGSGVFSSCASEPCPILRSNNVWSEAASSESVEMLLKSVGQEETVTIVEGPDACQKLNCVAERMESHFKEEEDKINVTDTDLRYLPEKVMDHGSGLINVEGVPNCPGVQITTHEKSHILRPNALGEPCVVYADDDDLDRKDCEKEAVTSLDKVSLNEKHDPSVSNMHTEYKDSQSQDVIVNTVDVANQETVIRVTGVGFDSASCLLTDSVNEVKGDNVVSKEVYVDGQLLKEAENLKNLPSSSSNSGIVAFHPVENSVSKLDEPSSYAVIRSMELHIAEECDEDVQAAELNKGSECDHIDSSDMTQIHQQFDEDIRDDLPKDFQGNGNFVADVFEVSTEKAEISSGLKLKMCPTIEVTNIPQGKTLMQGSDCQLGAKVLIRDNQASLLSNLNKKNSDVQGDGTSIIFEVENTIGTSTCFSAPLQEGEHSTIKSKIGDYTSSVHIGSNLEDRVTSATVSGLASDLNSIDHDQVVLSNGEDKPMFPYDSSEVERDVSEPFNHDKGVELSFNGGSSIDSAETSPLLYERGPHVDLAADEIGEISESGHVGPVGTNLTPLKDISQSTDKMDPVLEIEKVSASNSARELSREAADHSSPVGVTLDTASESGHMGVMMNVTAGQLSPMAEISDSGIQSVQAEKDFQNSESSSDKLELFPNIYYPTSKQNSDADGSDTPTKHGAEGKDHTLSPSEVSDSCLPTPNLSSYVFEASNSEKEEMVEKSLVKSIPPGGSVESACKEARQNDIGKDDKSFSFEVHLSSGVVGEYGQNMQLFPTTRSSKSNKEVSPLSLSVGNMEPKILLEHPRLSSKAPDLEIAHGCSTGTPTHKKGRASGKAPGKQRAKKRNSLKETTPSRQSEIGDDKSSVSTSLSGTGQLQFEGVKLHEKLEQSSLVSCSGVLVATHSLPDLNTSASPSALFLQPFSDIQQMQLRAQIFVYGSLIQGAAPDETCMVAAFGTSDGGRSMWEPVWRAFVEKLHGAKSNLRKSENPLQLQSGSNPPDESSTKTNSLKSTVLPSPAGQASSKGTPSPAINSIIPLSSPLWNISTPFHGLQSFGNPRSSVFDYHQTLSPSYPFQTPPSRNVAANNSSWQSHASFPAPWINVSQSSPFDGGTRLSITETVKLTPMKESVLSVASGTKYSFPSSTIDHSGPSVSAEPSPLPDVKKSVLSFVDSGAKHSFPSSIVLSSGPSMSDEPYPVADARKKTLPSGQKTAEPKSRKRKKSTASENQTQIPLLAQARTESIPALVPLFTQAQKELVPAPVSILGVPSHFSTSVIVSTPPFFGLKENDARIVATASPSYSFDQSKEIERSTEQKTNLPEDALIKAEAAKQHAEEAAALATAAVSYSQSIWDQMDRQKKIKLVPDVEDKIASAAVAVAAAAAVAKAAAAAAQVAFNAASQAKMMADEAWISGRVDTPVFSIASFISNKSPSIPKVGDEGNFSSSILVAAKEAAKKRVEAASFASKHAENLDAIVKAAELAAAAVSQAGRIVALGDPPSLAKLVEAGPEGYWRVPQVPPEQPNEECSNLGCIQATLNISGGHVNDEPSQKKAKTAKYDMSPLSIEIFKDSVDGIPCFFARSEKDSRGQRDSTATHLDKTIKIVPESESGLRPTCIISQDDNTKSIQTLKGIIIKEGSVVEVKKEGNGFKEAWFSANVLSMESGKAFVSYHASRSGSTQLKEWVSLEGDNNHSPRIRLPPPVTGVVHEGTRKRRRGAIGDYVCSLGDKVDVCVKECWREGVIIDKNKIDSTTITVHFPAEDETSIVRVWHLRPTFVWKDGVWIESSSSRQRDPSHMGDTPNEKRLKLDGPSVEESKKDNLSQTFQLSEHEIPAELQLLPLSDNEIRFNVGNNIKKDNKLDATRTVRSGLQKEGTRVVFGVPKPGKKKKFMEVNKNYGPESSNKTDPLKEKYMMPKSNAKEKRQGDLMTRVPKPGKPISSFGRTLSRKDKFPNSAAPTKNEGKKSLSNDGSESEQHKRSEFRPVSGTERAAQGSFVFSSAALSRNMFTSNASSERAKRGNRAPTVRKSTKEVMDKLDASKQIPENSEPRRSNRRTQPTSRLLEGLQSSLVIPKSPSFAHDKGHRSQNRSAPTES